MIEITFIALPFNVNGRVHKPAWVHLNLKLDMYMNLGNKEHKLNEKTKQATPIGFQTITMWFLGCSGCFLTDSCLHDSLICRCCLASFFYCLCMHVSILFTQTSSVKLEFTAHILGQNVDWSEPFWKICIQKVFITLHLHYKSITLHEH